MKNLALRELDTPGQFTLPLVERIVLYRQYDADKKYLGPLYEKLLSRAEPLTSEEGYALGMALVLLVSEAREHLRAICEKLPPLAPLPDSMKKTVAEKVRSVAWNGSAPGNAAKSSPSPVSTNKAGTSTSTANGKYALPVDVN